MSTQRAWQALPRHLRRRAASHDVRRVPARLRERAKAEVNGVLGRERPQLIGPPNSIDGSCAKESLESEAFKGRQE